MVMLTTIASHNISSAFPIRLVNVKWPIVMVIFTAGCYEISIVKTAYMALFVIVHIFGILT